MTTEYITRKELLNTLSILTYENQLVCEVCLATGIRLSDALALRTFALASPKIKIIEQKTGKQRKFTLSKNLYDRLITNAGSVFVFPHRLDKEKHRTRQAVWQDFKRAAKAFRIKQNIAPHSLRKIFAVEMMSKNGDLSKIQKVLNHSNEVTTVLYAFADKLKRNKRNPKALQGKAYRNISK